MKNTFTNRFVAFLTLLTGLCISGVAVYYSVAGLTAIFAAAVIPIMVMGITLEISKLVATVWLKQNWDVAPALIKFYLIAAIVTLMLVTSMGIFGFLSKAHSDQSLVSGDVQAKISIYDERIRVEKDTIETDRKALRQMDDAVDQLMSRSTDERGADKAVAIRRNQQKERNRLLAEISDSQKKISQLNDERAPIAAENRKVDAEVGPIKYIAAFFYGSTDQTILEKAVTWVIIILIMVFDPLAVILLLASQYSFQAMRPKETTEDEVAALAKKAETDPKVKMDLIELWNSMLGAAEQKTKSPVELPDTPKVWKHTVYPAKPKDNSATYVQNEEQTQGGRWKDINQAVTEKDYIEATKRNIEDMVKRVKSGIMPFYQVPEELKEEVKKELNVSKNNTDNAT